jgi:DNA-binding winged helix-turn-helix (wHTH) protein/tetratricopeptide (TPR) repeat protein
MDTTRIDLGLWQDVVLGRLTLYPAVRRILRDDDVEEIVEPRVMQVLLALIDGRGQVIRRETLTERCWEGRVVGEDAINRVLSRLRRVAEGIGAGSFRIETISKVGYRLVELGAASPVAEAPSPAVEAVTSAPVAARTPSRRVMLISGGVAAVAALAGGGGWWALRRSALSGPARAAMERGATALSLGAPDDLAVAAGAFREAADLAPHSAEPWGMLAIVYRWMYWSGHGNDAVIDAAKAREAAGKALAIDPANGDAQAALATLKPLFTNWLDYGAGLKPVFDRNPADPEIATLYIDMLSNVGQIHTLNGIARSFTDRSERGPTFYGDLLLSSWCLGRIDDADAARDRLMKLWPRRGGSWFICLRYLAYSGRAAEAMAMLQDVDNRPTGIPAWNFNQNVDEVRALLTRAPADIDKAAASFWTLGKTGAGLIANAVWFFAAVGRLDDAFRAIEALYFDRGFTLGVRGFSEEQGTYWPRRARPTWILWLPIMAGLRADPRLAPLVREMKLADYWRRSGTRPDFPIAGI